MINGVFPLISVYSLYIVVVVKENMLKGLPMFSRRRRHELDMYLWRLALACAQPWLVDFVAVAPVAVRLTLTTIIGNRFVVVSVVESPH